MIQRISPVEITYESGSVIDQIGRVFWWKDEIYRGIRPSYAEFYRNLFESAGIEIIFQHGLVPTEITTFSLEGFDLVLRHKVIPFKSYNIEWCMEMLKDASLMHLDLSRELFKKGLMIKDAHPWNILFDGGRPYLVDWGSIVPIQELWPYKEFSGKFLLPLWLMSGGLQRLVRTMMTDVLNEFQPRDVFKLLLGRIPFSTLYQYRSREQKLRRASRQFGLKFFDSLYQEIQSIPAAFERTEWSDYEGPDAALPLRPSEQWNAKIFGVHRAIENLKPRIVLDAGCNRGWFSRLAAESGCTVAAIDSDEGNITRMYAMVKKDRLPILPLLMDILSPTPHHGLMHGYPAADERLRADMVLALALTHHLVFKRNFPFDAICKQLAIFSKRWLLVEFVPPEDRYVKEWISEKFSWYHLDGFLKALQVYFQRIEVMDSFPKPRVLVLCEK